MFKLVLFKFILFILYLFAAFVAKFKGSNSIIVKQNLNEQIFNSNSDKSGQPTNWINPFITRKFHNF
jgi:hypothetical protein